MAVNNIALVQLDVLGVHMLERNHTPIGGTDNGLRTRILVGSILNQRIHAVQIVGSYALGVSQIHRNLERNTEFTDRNVRIWCNN